MSQVVGLPNNSHKPITNTEWVRAPLCKLQKGCTQLAAASDKVYQLLAHGRWFSLGTPVSSTTKTGRHDISDILLINQSIRFRIVLSGEVQCLAAGSDIIPHQTTPQEDSSLRSLNNRILFHVCYNYLSNLVPVYPGKHIQNLVRKYLTSIQKSCLLTLSLEQKLRSLLSCVKPRRKVNENV